MISKHCDPNFLPTVETEGSRMIVILRSFNFLNFPQKKLLKIHSMSSRLSSVLNLKIIHFSRCFKQTFDKVTCCRFSKTVTLVSISQNYNRVSDQCDMTCLAFKASNRLLHTVRNLHFLSQKFNFFPEKIVNFFGEKLVKMLWFWTF